MVLLTLVSLHKLVVLYALSPLTLGLILSYIIASGRRSVRNWTLAYRAVVRMDDARTHSRCSYKLLHTRGRP